MTEKEVKEYIRIIYNGIPKLYNRLNEAQEELEKKNLVLMKKIISTYLHRFV